MFGWVGDPAWWDVTAGPVKKLVKMIFKQEAEKKNKQEAEKLGKNYKWLIT